MNIKKFYKKIASMYLNISLILTFSSLVFILLNLYVDSDLVLFLVLPFLFLSCLYFISFLIYKRWYYRLPGMLPLNDRTPLEEENILLVFMPAPTLHILLFHPKGTLLGEIKDEKKQWYKWFIPNSLSLLFPHSYELIDYNGNVLATYKNGHFFSSKQAFYNHEGKEIATYKQNWKKSLFRYSGEVTNSNHSLHLIVDVSGFLHSFSIETIDDRKIGSFQKGWMPLEWGEKFKVFNTPILTFSSTSTDEEKLCIFGICSYLLSYSKN